MISSIIFFLHFVFLIVIFTIKWQRESVGSAFINLAFIILLFAVGWSLSTMFVKLLMEPDGFGIYLDRDTFSLLLLTIVEFFFFKGYYKKDFTEDDKEK